jgi:hypothetical protein
LEAWRKADAAADAIAANVLSAGQQPTMDMAAVPLDDRCNASMKGSERSGRKSVTSRRRSTTSSASTKRSIASTRASTRSRLSQGAASRMSGASSGQASYASFRSIRSSASAAKSADFAQTSASWYRDKTTMGDVVAKHVPKLTKLSEIMKFKMRTSLTLSKLIVST